MIVQINIHQTRTVVEGPLYRIYTEVTYSTGIDRRIFVFDAESEEFSHVATTWEMENYPSSLAEARVAAIGFYRADRCTKDYTEEGVASNFAVYTRGRIEFLANQYEGMQNDFIGEDDYVYTGGA